MNFILNWSFQLSGTKLGLIKYFVTFSIFHGQVEDSLLKVRNAGTEQDLGIQYKALKPEVDKLNMMAAKRQQVRAS